MSLPPRRPLAPATLFLAPLHTSWNLTLSSLDATMMHPSSAVRDHHVPPSLSLFGEFVFPTVDREMSFDSALTGVESPLLASLAAVVAGVAVVLEEESVSPVCSRLALGIDSFGPPG